MCSLIFSFYTMILNQEGNNIQTVGDIQQHQIGIDARNIEHIITILSSNLYSNPEESFLRETVCNAVDSHIEAKSDEPIVLSLIQDEDYNHTVSIRDFGTGISPERFEQIYLNIGSSTKRDSNDYIGAFGIGRFSALACADVVHITSYYNGIAYYYVMMKNASKINVDKISELPTKEKNGVEVRINVDSLSPYMDALKYLWYIPNIYIHSNTGRDEVESFNNRKLEEFDTFRVGLASESYKDPYLVYGKVIYSYNVSKLDNKYYIFRDILRQINIKFNITELDITPNRENLLYSEKTIKALESKLDKVLEEIRAICQEGNKDLTNMLEYYHCINSGKIIKLGSKSVSVAKTDMANLVNYTYKGKVIGRDTPIYNALWRIYGSYLCDLPILAIIENQSLWSKKKLRRTSLHEVFYERRTNEALNPTIIVLPSAKGTKSPFFKNFLLEEKSYTGVTIFVAKPDMSRSAIKSWPHEDFGVSGNLKDTIFVAHEVMRGFAPYCIQEDIIGSPEYQNYKKSHSKKAASTKLTASIRFYTTTYYPQYDHFYSSYMDADTITEVNKYLKDDNPDKPVLYGEREDPLFTIFNTLCTSERRGKFSIVKVAKCNLKYLQPDSLPNDWIPISSFVNGNMQEVVDAITYNSFGFYIDKVDDEIIRCMLPFIPKEDSEAMKKVLWYDKGRLKPELFPILNSIIPEFTKNGNQYNRDMVQGFKILKKYVEIAKKLHGIFNLGKNAQYLFAYTAMKRGLVRLNNESYQYIKENLNPNYKEDEDN